MVDFQFLHVSELSFCSVGVRAGDIRVGAMNSLPIINFSDNFFIAEIETHCITKCSRVCSRIADMGGSRSILCEQKFGSANQLRQGAIKNPPTFCQPTKNAHKFTSLTTAWSFALCLLCSRLIVQHFFHRKQMVPP